MKKFSGITLIFVMVLVLVGPKLSFVEQWYLGGTLQDVTAAQWRVTPYDNKLATAAIGASWSPESEK